MRLENWAGRARANERRAPGKRTWPTAAPAARDRMCEAELRLKDARHRRLYSTPTTQLRRLAISARQRNTQDSSPKRPTPHDSPHHRNRRSRCAWTLDRANANGNAPTSHLQRAARRAELYRKKSIAVRFAYCITSPAPITMIANQKPVSHSPPPPSLVSAPSVSLSPPLVLST